MTPAPNVANPFALMLYPESVLAAVASSDRLARLKSRICRPLDKAVNVPAEGEAPDAPLDAQEDPQFGVDAG